MIKWIMENKDVFMNTIASLFSEESRDDLERAIAAVLDLMEDPLREVYPDIKLTRNISDFELFGQLHERIAKLRSIIPDEADDSPSETD